jgi:RNA polymerase sigma factor (sigma-70 family)
MELDEELRAGLQAGAPDWAAIYAGCRKVMWRAAWQVLGPDYRSTLGISADSIVQETMVELMEKTRESGISAIPFDVESIDAFLWTATRRRALRVVERAQRKEMVPYPESDEPGERGVEDDLEALEDALILEQLDSHLGELTENERRAFIGYFKQDRTYADIGAELGVTDRWASKLCGSAVRRLTALVGIDAQKGGDDG